MNEDDQSGRRRFIAIATSEYDSDQFCGLDSVPAEITVLTDWLCSPRLDTRRFEHHAQDLAHNPGKTMLRTILEHPGPTDRFRHDDIVVLYVTGHGQVTHDQHWIILRSTEPDKPFRTALSTAELIGWLREHEIENALVVIDTCYAGKVTKSVLGTDAAFPEGWMVLATSNPRQMAQSRAFTDALSGFLEEARKGVYGEGPYLNADHLIGYIGSELRRHGQELVAHPRTYGPSCCLPNPGYRIAIRQEDLETHWDPRSRGVEGAGWFFTGRAELMRRLVEFTNGSPGAIVVTGPAGCGKSAALARILHGADVLA